MDTYVHRLQIQTHRLQTQGSYTHNGEKAKRIKKKEMKLSFIPASTFLQFFFFFFFFSFFLLYLGQENYIRLSQGIEKKNHVGGICDGMIGIPSLSFSLSTNLHTYVYYIYSVCIQSALRFRIVKVLFCSLALCLFHGRTTVLDTGTPLLLLTSYCTVYGAKGPEMSLRSLVPKY